MSLVHLKSALLAADFKPHCLTIGADIRGLSQLASPSSLHIFARAWRHGDRATIEEVFSGNPWPTPAREAYVSLPEEKRMEVLGLTGFQIHESVHKIDFLTTPFGVAFYGRSCLETLGFQECAPQIITWLERPAGHPPMRELTGDSDAERVQDGLEGLSARIRWFDAIRGAPSRFVEEGWGGDRSLVTLLNFELRKVTVHNLMSTLELPGQTGAYLRPLTILESRAVAISLLHLFDRLGADDYACSEIARYVRLFYPHSSTSNDYTFLLNLFAYLGGAPDFPSLIEQGGPAVLKGILQNIVVLGWYALHAPPLMPTEVDSYANSSSVVRLMIALKNLEAAIATRTEHRTGAHFLEAVDNSDTALAVDIAPCRDVLAYCIQYLEVVKARNRAENAHPSLALHFDYIFEIQLAQLRRRLKRGYASSLGMPDGGHLLGGFEDFDVDHHLLLETYAAPCDVQQWFAFRENLLFTHARPRNFAIQVRSFIDSRPRAARAIKERNLDNTEPVLSEGLRAFETGDYTTAEPHLAQAAEGGSAVGAYCLGVVLRERGERPLAEQAFAQASAGGIAEGAYNLGVLLRERDDLGRAQEAFSHADSLGDPDGSNDFGLLLLEEGDLARAVPALCRADARGHPEAPNSVGAFHAAAHAFLLARQAFERADARGSAKGSHNLAIACTTAGDHQAAADAARRAKQRGFRETDRNTSQDEITAPAEQHDEAPDFERAGELARETFAAMVSQLEARFPEFSAHDVIHPLCMGLLAGANVLISVPSASFEYATLLVEAATQCVADSVTFTLTPAIAVSRRAVGLAPREANFLILKDISRFREDTLADLRPILGDAPNEERCFEIRGRLVPLPNLLAVIAIKDLDHEAEGKLAELVPLFWIGIRVSL
jgi:TPR repeat protein